MEYLLEKIIFELTINTLFDLIDKDLDSIWIFILNNLYAPISLMEANADLIIGNPPWIVMRTIENTSYQNFLKKETKSYNLLKGIKPHYFTQMEIATLFFRKCADIYLKNDGIIGFLMPISVLSAAGHHKPFQRFENPNIKLLSILNFEKIRSIFSLPVYVLIGIKNHSTTFPVPMKYYSGPITKFRKNEKFEIIKNILEIKEVFYEPSIEPLEDKYSYYYNKLIIGGSLYPRPFWFVDFNIAIGFDIDNPPVISSEKAKKVSKPKWRDVTIEKTIESEYIFVTLLGKDLIPFGIVGYRPIILPIETENNHFRLLDSNELNDKGKPLMSRWLQEAQEYWESRRTEKSAIEFPRVINRVDKNNDVTRQSRGKRYLVLYNARGANAVAYVLDKEKIPEVSIHKDSKLKDRTFIADYTTYYCTTEDFNEAHYISGILNSSLTNKKVKSFQPRGQYGKRDIGKRQFKLLIPKYDKENDYHKSLLNLSITCHNIIAEHTFRRRTFRSMRNESLKILKDKINEIDETLKNIIID